MTAIKKKGVLVVKLRCFAAVLRPDILKNPALRQDIQNIRFCVQKREIVGRWRDSRAC